MCRFALYLGPPITLDTLITKPVNSIIHQSFHSHERKDPLNADGFGVAWYVPELSLHPAVFRSITPAWNDENLLNLAPLTISE
jgi:predicted glutamine amidotransferase